MNDKARSVDGRGVFIPHNPQNARSQIHGRVNSLMEEKRLDVTGVGVYPGPKCLDLGSRVGHHRKCKKDGDGEDRIRDLTQANLT